MLLSCQRIHTIYYASARDSNPAPSLSDDSHRNREISYPDYDRVFIYRIDLVAIPLSYCSILFLLSKYMSFVYLIKYILSENYSSNIKIIIMGYRWNINTFFFIPMNLKLSWRLSILDI